MLGARVVGVCCSVRCDGCTCSLTLSLSLSLSLCLSLSFSLSLWFSPMHVLLLSSSPLLALSQGNKDDLEALLTKSHDSAGFDVVLKVCVRE